MSSSDASDDSIALTVFCPIRPSLGDPSQLEYVHTAIELTVPAKSTVDDVKAQLEREMHGNPAKHGQMLIYRGRLLKDNELIAVVVADSRTQQESSDAKCVLHLSVSRSAWKTTLDADSSTVKAPNVQIAADRLAALSNSLQSANSTALSSSATATTSQAPLVTPDAPLLANLASPFLEPMPLGSFPDLAQPTGLPANSSRSSSNPWKSFMNHFLAMSPSQRSEFVVLLSQTERHYLGLVRFQMERQGPHMAPLTAEDIASLQETGHLASLAHPHPASTSSSVDYANDHEAIALRTEALLEACNFMHLVRLAQTDAKTEFEKANTAQNDLFGGQTTSQIVNIAGYPFLLQIPKRFSVSYDKRLEAFLQLRRYQYIHKHLEIMLNLTKAHMLNNNPIAANQRAAALAAMHAQAAGNPASQAAVGNVGAVAAGQRGGPAAAVRPGGFGAIGIGAERAAQLGGGPGARLAVVINLDEILSLLFPLLFLTVKLGFLIYIFGRHASFAKRAIMISMAIIWTIWEGITIRRRRRTLEARRNLAREVGGAQPRRQQHQQPAQPQQGQNGAQQAPGPVPAQQGQAAPIGGPAQQQPEQQRLVRRGHRQAGDAGAAQNGTHRSSSHRHRQQPNRLSPKYWMQVIARVGISAENREMGISRSHSHSSSSSSSPSNTSSSQLHVDPNAPQVLTYQRALRNLWIGIVLFFGTLVPEIERLRNKVLEKRQRRITEMQNLRIAAEQAANQITQQQEDQNQQGGQGQRLLQDASGIDPAQPLFSASDAAQDQATTSASRNENSNRLGNASEQGNAPATPSHLQNNALGVSGESTPLTPAELLDPQDARSGLNGDEELFDPPFDDAALAAALAESTGVSGAAGSSTSLRAPGAGAAEVAAGLAAPGDQPRAQGAAEPTAGNARFARNRDNAHEVNNLHLQLPSAAERARAATGQDPDTPLLSPNEQDTDDEIEGERREDGEGVDDEVGMILF